MRRLWREFQDSRSKFLSRGARKYIFNDKLTPVTIPATLVKPTGTGKTRSKSAKCHPNPLLRQAGTGGILADFGDFEGVFPVPVGFTSVAGVVTGVNLSIKILF